MPTHRTYDHRIKQLIANTGNQINIQTSEYLYLRQESGSKKALPFQNKARQLGGSAVVENTSIYRGRQLSSSREFLCGAGTLIAGGFFQARIVDTISKKVYSTKTKPKQAKPSKSKIEMAKKCQSKGGVWVDSQ